MLGVAILMIVLAVMTGFGDEWRDKILSFKPHITVYHKSGLIQDTESACALIEAVDDVETVSPTIVSPVMLRYDERKDPVMATVIGIDGDRASIVSRQIASGENLFAGEYNVSGNNVMIGRDLAKRLSVPVGATLLCYSPLNLNSENALYFPEELVVAGVYDTGMRDIDDLIAITSLGMARDIVGIDDGAQTIQVQTSNPEMAWREAAEIEAALGPGFKASAQVSPGFAQGVLVQRGLGALPFFTALDALGGHQRHTRGQASLRGRVAAAAAIEVHLHIHHGDDGAFHQPDLGAVGFGPVLDGQQRPCRISTKQGSSAYQ